LAKAAPPREIIEHVACYVARGMLPKTVELTYFCKIINEIPASCLTACIKPQTLSLVVDVIINKMP